MKTLSRIKDGVTGEEYYLGEKGDSHVCIVELSSNDTIDWTKYAVSVYDQTAKTTQKQTLSADGVAKFLVPYSHTYTVTMPTISGYPAPATRTYTASELLTTRYVTHSYLTDYEELDIHAKVITSTGDDASMLYGKSVNVIVGKKVKYTGTFDELGRCIIYVAWGDTYTLQFPDIEGYTHDHQADEHTAGLQSREITIHYSLSTLGLYGYDADGNTYFYDDYKAKIDAATDDTEKAALQAKIVAIGFNPASLAAADRGDTNGTVGCGFIVPITGNKSSGSWAGAQLAFNPNKLPYVTSTQIAGQGKNVSGLHNSKMMREIMDNGEVGTWTWDETTQSYIGSNLQTTDSGALAACETALCPINDGKDRDGFLPSYQQMRELVLQYSLFSAWFTLLGKTAPTITSGSWWTSCQSSETYAVYLNYGGFSITIKTGSGSVLVCFDL